MSRIKKLFIEKPERMRMGVGKLANRYKVTEEEIRQAKVEARKELFNKTGVMYLNTPEITSTLIESSYTVEINLKDGTWKSQVESDFDPKSDIELAQLHKVDLEKYKISSYWSKQKSNGKFTSSVFATLIKAEDNPEDFQKSFREFLSEFKPSKSIVKRSATLKKSKVALILPKQDAHFNKFDISGDNDILERFKISSNAVLSMLEKAVATNNLEQVVYIVGSDQFNSEWTSLTTKGTPQQNILSYQDAFTSICNHEVEIINTLLHYSEKVKVVFVPGNHDEFVGWHLINWLESYFREDSTIEFDSSTLNTKYIKYNDSAIMINHGDDIKAKELAYKFPIGFKEHWSSCNNYYIFTGDKHTELSLDIHGIKFYQVPQLSSAKSKWDDKKGYIDSKAEMTGFIISSDNGMTDIYKEIL